MALQITVTKTPIAEGTKKPFIKPINRLQLTSTKRDGTPSEIKEGTINLGVVKIDWLINMSDLKGEVGLTVFGFFKLIDAGIDKDQVKIEAGIDIGFAKADAVIAVDWDKGIFYNYLVSWINPDGTWTTHKDEGWLLFWGKLESIKTPL